MTVTFITESDRMFKFTEVFNLRFDSRHKKLSFCVKEDYEAYPEDVHEYNLSTLPYCKLFYDVISIFVDEY